MKAEENYKKTLTVAIFLILMIISINLMRLFMQLHENVNAAWSEFCFLVQRDIIVDGPQLSVDSSKSSVFWFIFNFFLLIDEKYQKKSSKQNQKFINSHCCCS